MSNHIHTNSSMPQCCQMAGYPCKFLLECPRAYKKVKEYYKEKGRIEVSVPARGAIDQLYGRKLKEMGYVRSDTNEDIMYLQFEKNLVKIETFKQHPVCP